MAQSPHRPLQYVLANHNRTNQALSASFSLLIHFQPYSHLLQSVCRAVCRSCSNTISHTLPYSQSWKTLCDYCTSSGEARLAMFVWLLNRVLLWYRISIFSLLARTSRHNSIAAGRVEMWLCRHWEERLPDTCFYFSSEGPLRGYKVFCPRVACKHLLVTFLNLRLSSLTL